MVLKSTLVKRMVGAFALTTLLFLITTLHTTRVLQQLSDSAAEQNRVWLANWAAHQLDSEILTAIVLLGEYQRNSNPGIRHQILESRASTRSLIRELRTHTRLHGVVEELEAFETLFPARTNAADEVMAAVEAGADAGELHRLTQVRAQLDAQARQHLRRILAVEEQAVRRVAAADERLRQDARWQVTMLWVLNVGVLILLGYSLAQHLRTRIAELVSMTRRMGGGDYSARVPVRGQDELDRVAQHFNDMAEQLGEIDKVKGEFLALASHQLRTPATGVKANLGMLLEGYCGPLTAEQEEYLQDAYRSNERQLAIVDDLLAVARVEAGQMTLNREPVDLVELVRAVVAEQRSVLQQREQSVTIQRSPEPVIAHVDAQRVRMVLDNLVNNASKYSFTRGRIRIHVRGEDDFALISVSDDGIGIDHKDLPKLYKKFSRIDNPLARSVTGTGLGLYLAYEIVRLHGGEITAQSELGSGTTFLVRLAKGEAQ